MNPSTGKGLLSLYMTDLLDNDNHYDAVVHDSDCHEDAEVHDSDSQMLAENRKVRSIGVDTGLYLGLG